MGINIRDLVLGLWVATLLLYISSIFLRLGCVVGVCRVGIITTDGSGSFGSQMQSGTSDIVEIMLNDGVYKKCMSLVWQLCCMCLFEGGIPCYRPEVGR